MSSFKTFPNLSGVLSKLGKLPDAVAHELHQQMNQEAEEILTAAKERTPVDTGNLRASEHQVTVRQGTQIRATIKAGGPAAEYAVVVHEDLEAHHETGQAKYMESAVLDQFNSGMDDRLAQRVTDAAKKVGL